MDKNAERKAKIYEAQIVKNALKIDGNVDNAKKLAKELMHPTQDKKADKPIKKKKKSIEEKKSNIKMFGLIGVCLLLLVVGIVNSLTRDTDKTTKNKNKLPANTFVTEKETSSETDSDNNNDIENVRVKPHFIGDIELHKINWNDNPVVLEKVFKIQGFFNGKPMRVRINHALKTTGEFLDKRFQIVDIKPPVVFLSDDEGNIHRLVRRTEWNNAAYVFGWKKGIFKSTKPAKVKNPMTKDGILPFVGAFELVNASKEQIISMQNWLKKHPKANVKDLRKELNTRNIKHKPVLSTSFGGKITRK